MSSKRGSLCEKKLQLVLCSIVFSATLMRWTTPAWHRGGCISSTLGLATSLSERQCKGVFIICYEEAREHGTEFSALMNPMPSSGLSDHM